VTGKFTSRGTALGMSHPRCPRARRSKRRAPWCCCVALSSIYPTIEEMLDRQCEDLRIECGIPVQINRILANCFCSRARSLASLNWTSKYFFQALKLLTFSSIREEVCEVHLPHHFCEAGAVHVCINILLQIQLVTGKVK
jgi:hypothetical protein